MSGNIEKLLKCIQNTQKFVGDRISQDPIYTHADKTLKELDASLKAKKLTLHIVGSLESAQAFQRLLDLNDESKGAYQPNVFSLPELPDCSAPPSAALILQCSQTESSRRYELEDSKVYVAGRNPAIAQILLPDHLNLVSGSHIQFRCINGVWQVQDSDSRNGTFVNDNPQKLQGWYTLKGGDRISLGSAFQTSGSATFVFDCPSVEDLHLAYLEAKKIVDCNILCLVTPPQSLQESTQRFLELAEQTQALKLFVIVDKPGGITSEVDEEILTKIRGSLEHWLPSRSFELISLLLKPFTPSSAATILVPHAQPEFESFSETLNILLRDKAETLLIEWAAEKFYYLLNQLESHLVQRSSHFTEQLQQNEAKLKELLQGSFKKQAEKNYKKVDGERDSLFRQLKSEVSQSKSSLLDEFRQSSISYKIQQFTKHLHPHITDQNGYRYVCLRLHPRKTSTSSISDVHIAATELCHTELTRWATGEWVRIRSEYLDGGLNGFLERSYEFLNFCSEFQLPKEDFSSSQTLSIQSVLNVSNVEPTLEMRYKQPGLWGYMFKSLRGQIISIVGTIMMLVGALAKDLSDHLKVILIPSLVPFVLALVWISYIQEKEAKVEEVTEKLQKEAANYYQSYMKGLVDRLAQRINGLLETEERRFREVLENTKELYASHQSELDKTQSQLKSQVEEMKRSGQSKIDKDLIELRNIKQSILP